ncbi:alpha/beta hydrolase [Pelagicoccus enzymogenes]|uniref:alpha/beta hydrolase n=1 Tax=Pelagicoccus enzymogenes TaxID=2773457 RepID=UPI0028117B4B|nr:alpha/beta hydrolase-fold protein [Pelagicoccus enzymogenes]
MGLLAAMVAWGSGDAKPVPSDPSTWIWNDPSEIVGVKHGVVWSESMQRKMGYSIYLPPSYAASPNMRYPVVFWLHGAYGKENDIGLAMVAKRLVDAGEIGEVIYVVPNSGQFSQYRDWPDENVKAETWIIRELIPAIDERYRTIARGEGRAVAGFSMGGEGAIRLGFKYPDLFCAIVSCSAALQWPSHLSGVDLDDGEDALYWAEANRTRLSGGAMPLYVTMGDSERFFAGLPPFLLHLHKRDIKVRAQVFPGLGHDLGETYRLVGEDLVAFMAEHYVSARIE